MRRKPADRTPGGGTGPPPLLEVEDLSVSYSRTGLAVDRVSFRVEQGESVAILGPNGAGKTTTVRSISGFLSSERVDVSAARLELDGESVLRAAPHRLAARGLAVVPERDKVFRQLLVSENLELARGRRPDPATADIQALLFELFPVLPQRLQEAAGYLSGGQIQMLAIAMAVLSRPRLLVADEISLGLAPALLDEIIASLKTIRAELGLTMLLVEQNVGVAAQLCPRGVVLQGGQIRAAASTEELMAEGALANIYFGGTA